MATIDEKNEACLSQLNGSAEEDFLWRMRVTTSLREEEFSPDPIDEKVRESMEERAISIIIAALADNPLLETLCSSSSVH